MAAGLPSDKKPKLQAFIGFFFFYTLLG